MSKSPFSGKPISAWEGITKKLLKAHPLDSDTIVEVVLAAWQSIFDSRMGSQGFRIGVDMFPKPQIMGFFLHELIPLELVARFPNEWRGDKASDEKDIVYLPDRKYSVEIKTSSNPNRIFGNRSYAQKTTTGKKAKSGYYLAVNFEKFTDTNSSPVIKKIRFGWIDASDWMGQRAASGQQSRLSADVETRKLKTLYPIV
jgi:hypothetical protein